MITHTVALAILRGSSTAAAILRKFTTFSYGSPPCVRITVYLIIFAFNFLNTIFLRFQLQHYEFAVMSDGLLMIMTNTKILGIDQNTWS